MGHNGGRLDDEGIVEDDSGWLRMLNPGFVEGVFFLKFSQWKIPQGRELGWVSLGHRRFATGDFSECQRLTICLGVHFQWLLGKYMPYIAIHQSTLSLQ